MALGMWRRRLTPMIGLLLVLLCAVISALVLSDRHFQGQLLDVSSRAQIVVRDVERIRYYDEVLTSSARLAAATGDRRYERRYQKRAPELDAVIEEALLVADSPRATAAINQTGAANRALIKLEERSFRLDNEGRRSKALALLSSPAYLEQKEAYVDGLERGLSIMLAGVHGDIDEVRKYRDIALAVGLLGGLIVAVAGGLLLRLSRERDRLTKELHAESSINAFNSLHDPLTGLPNRSLFSDRLEHQLIRADREPSSFSVLVFDLDRFKEVNDSFGHSAGDRLLCEVDSRVRPSLRAGDTLARLGGDEFAVLLPSTGRGSAGQVAERVLRGLQEPFMVGTVPVDVGASIGAVTYPEHGEDAEALVHHADVAMYLAKDRALGVCFYEPQPNRPWPPLG